MPESVQLAGAKHSAPIPECHALWQGELSTNEARDCAAALRRAYIKHDVDLSAEQGRLDLALLVTAVSGVATATFGAHPDTTAALGLLGGSLGSTRGYFNVDARAQALAIGRSGMNCILESSAALVEKTARLNERIVVAHSQLASAVDRAEAAKSVAAGTPGSQAAARAADVRAARAELARVRIDAIGAIARANSRATLDVALQATSNLDTADGHAELIRQAIHRVSEQVILAYRFGTVQFKGTGTQVRQAVDDALEIAALGDVGNSEDEALIDPIKRAGLSLVVDTARLNSCGRSGD